MRVAYLLLSALATCATTPASSQLPTAIANYSTAKIAKDIAACLGERSGPLSLVRNGNRETITSRDAKPGLAIYVFDNGTVQVWRYSSSESETRSLVQSCV